MTDGSFLRVVTCEQDDISLTGLFNGNFGANVRHIAGRPGQFHTEVIEYVVDETATVESLGGTTTISVRHTDKLPGHGHQTVDTRSGRISNTDSVCLCCRCMCEETQQPKNQQTVSSF